MGIFLSQQVKGYLYCTVDTGYQTFHDQGTSISYITSHFAELEQKARGGDAHHSRTLYASFGAVYSICRAKTGKCWKESTTIVTPCLVEFYNLSSYSKES